MKVLVIDGQGGSIGKMLITLIKQRIPSLYVIAIGTNSIATANMLKAGADTGATGENPVIYNCRDADLILGPMGILLPNALLGEITTKMAVAVNASPAEKYLIPLNKCGQFIVGIQPIALADLLKLAVTKVEEFVERTPVQESRGY